MTDPSRVGPAVDRAILDLGRLAMMVSSFLPLIATLACAAGIVFLTLGLSGRLVFSHPRCAKCDHDLRTRNFLADDLRQCPECGANLNAPHTVDFGKRRRWRGMIAGGITLILLALLIPVGLKFYSQPVRAAAGTGFSSGLTTPALLAQLPKTIGQLWDWLELENRLRSGQLTPQEAETAIGVVTADLNDRRAQGKTWESCPWWPSFITLAIQRKLIGPQKLQAFFQAYLAEAPRLDLRDRQRADQPMKVNFGFDSPWKLEGLTVCWALENIVADGHTPLKPINLEKKGALKADHPDQFSEQGLSSVIVRFELNSLLPPGEHELVFTFDIGVFRYPIFFHGVDGRPGTADKWPPTIAHWQITIPKKIHVVGKDKPVVTLVTDENENPFQEMPLEVIARPADSGVDIAIAWKERDKPPSLSLSYQGELHVGTQHCAFGGFYSHVSAGVWSCNGPVKFHFEILPAEVKTVDVRLTPDVEQIEHIPDLERLWGRPLEFKNIPLRRLDLELRK